MSASESTFDERAVAVQRVPAQWQFRCGCSLVMIEPRNENGTLTCPVCANTERIADMDLVWKIYEKDGETKIETWVRPKRFTHFRRG